MVRLPSKVPSKNPCCGICDVGLLSFCPEAAGAVGRDRGIGYQAEGVGKHRLGRFAHVDMIHELATHGIDLEQRANAMGVSIRTVFRYLSAE